MDKYKIKKVIEKLSEEEQKEIHKWLWDLVSKKRNKKFKKSINKLKRFY